MAGRRARTGRGWDAKPPAPPRAAPGAGDPSIWDGVDALPPGSADATPSWDDLAVRRSSDDATPGWDDSAMPRSTPGWDDSAVSSAPTPGWDDFGASRDATTGRDDTAVRPRRGRSARADAAPGRDSPPASADASFGRDHPPARADAALGRDSAPVRPSRGRSDEVSSGPRVLPWSNKDISDGPRVLPWSNRDTRDPAGSERDSRSNRADPGDSESERDGRGSDAGSERDGRRGSGGRGRGTAEQGAGRAERRAERERAEQQRDPHERAREICLRQLAVRPRTRAELAAAMKKNGIEQDVADSVLERYDEVGIINDAAFAKAWVSSRHHSKGLATRALAQELRRRGVDKETADEALSELDPETEATTAGDLARRKLRTMHGEPDAVFRRLLGMLARKGYSGGVAVRAVKDALAERDSELADLIDPDLYEE